VKPVAVAYAS